MSTAIFLVSFKIIFKRKLLFRFFEKLNRIIYGLKFFQKILCRFPSKNKQPPFWIDICFRPIKLIFVFARLWKLDTCIVFFANVYASFISCALFLSELSLFFNIRQRCLPCFSFNKNQNSHTLFRMKLTIKQQFAFRLQLNTKQPYIVSLSTNTK